MLRKARGLIDRPGTPCQVGSQKLEKLGSVGCGRQKTRERKSSSGVGVISFPATACPLLLSSHTH